MNNKLCESEGSNMKQIPSDGFTHNNNKSMTSLFQAIKFRGLNMISPSNSMRHRRRIDGGSCSFHDGTVASTSSIGNSSSECHCRGSSGVNVQHPIYECSSLTESTAKKLTKKRPMEVMAHSETQLVRVYPASMRIDSSNFNPLNFWSYGIQMAAINYQSECLTASHVNAAMFEQNGRCGYVLKPKVMHDPTHILYRRFNPQEKRFDGLNPIRLTVDLVSGQYCSPFGASRMNVFVEIEIIGIPPDSVKKKSKIISYNSLNPVWHESFTFHVLFEELAFIRFLIVDANTNHALAQRVIPLKSVRYGYRHIDMRNTQNHPLALTSLFVYTLGIEEAPMPTEDDKISSSTSPGGENGVNGGCGQLPHRKSFNVTVYGVFSEKSHIIVKVTQDSTVIDVIKLALNKRDDPTDVIETFVLLEEGNLTWEVSVNATTGSSDEIIIAPDPSTAIETSIGEGSGNNKNDKNEKKTIKKSKINHRRVGWNDPDEPIFQRVLDFEEKPLEAQARWPGYGYFVLKKIGDDPSSRAWLISLQSKNKRKNRCWDEVKTFLVCIHNISEERPYVILKVPIGSTAQDILAQILLKARRMENPNMFILVEEVDWGGTDVRYRVLGDDEVVYKTQQKWSRCGKFVLEERCSKEDQEALNNLGLISLTSRGLRAVTRTLRLHKGMTIIGRRLRICGLPPLPCRCLRRPDNNRVAVIREAAVAHKKLSKAQERQYRITLEKDDCGDSGGGLERGCDDDGSGYDDAEERRSFAGYFKCQLFYFWRS